MSEDTTQNLTTDDKLNLILVEMREQRGLLSSLNDRVTALEAKSFDTRPIWEQVLKEIMETRTELSKQISEVRSEMVELRADVRQMSRKVGLLNDDMLTLRADVTELYARQDKAQPRQ